MMSGEVVLVDLSSIAHPIWHMSQTEPDPNHTSQQIVARVRALATEHPHVAICCDSGRSFRHEIAASYKANRPESLAPLQHQIDVAREQLIADGFPVWAVRGFEADDVIATATARALAIDGATVLIVSADKDLLQLVDDRVNAKSVRDGSILDAAAVVAKFGVRPEQMRDYLTLVGDTSDNVKGAKGIGPKKAADVLAKFETLDAVYAALDKSFGVSIGLPTSVEMSLREFKPNLETARTLITLRTDVEIPFEEISVERVPKEAQTFGMVIEEEESMELQQPTAEEGQPKDAAPSVDAAQEKVTDLPGNSAAVATPSASRLNSTALAVVQDAEIMPAPVQWERQLDPRSLKDARALALDMHQSRLFSAYGTPQGVLSTVMLGRELGMPAMASLRGVHIIEGRHALAAATMVALVLKSGFAEYFEPVSFDELQATFETKRKGGRNPIKLTHTIEMAKTAGLLKPNSNWEKIPTDMLVARAQSRLCRLVYPDIVGGLYTPDELKDSANNATKVA